MSTIAAAHAEKAVELIRTRIVALEYDAGNTPLDIGEAWNDAPNWQAIIQKACEDTLAEYLSAPAEPDICFNCDDQLTATVSSCARCADVVTVQRTTAHVSPCSVPHCNGDGFIRIPGYLPRLCPECGSALRRQTIQVDRDPDDSKRVIVTGPPEVIEGLQAFKEVIGVSHLQGLAQDYAAGVDVALGAGVDFSKGEFTYPDPGPPVQVCGRCGLEKPHQCVFTEDS